MGPIIRNIPKPGGPDPMPLGPICTPTQRSIIMKSRGGIKEVTKKPTSDGPSEGD